MAICSYGNAGGSRALGYCDFLVPAFGMRLQMSCNCLGRAACFGARFGHSASDVLSEQAPAAAAEFSGRMLGN